MQNGDKSETTKSFCSLGDERFDKLYDALPESLRLDLTCSPLGLILQYAHAMLEIDRIDLALARTRTEIHKPIDEIT